MQKTALFVFNGDPMCFIHVLLNALDMHGRGETAAIVVEGAATGLIPELERQNHPLHALWEKTKAADLVAGACKACSGKMGVLETVRSLGMPLLAEMSGHPSMSRYREAGYTIITF
jgi:hypothetical protein